MRQAWGDVFSLTLTLSRWEREQPLSTSVKFVGSEAEYRRSGIAGKKQRELVYFSTAVANYVEAA